LIISKALAKLTKNDLHHFYDKDMLRKGLKFIKAKDYLSRWDGYFAFGVPYAVGLYEVMQNKHPNTSKRIMSSLPGWKGRLYEHSSKIEEYWLKKKENNFDKPIELFPNHAGLLNKEKGKRKILIKQLIDKIKTKRLREDILVDITYNLFSINSKFSTRSSFLYENGMPVFDGIKEIREYFMSLPVSDKNSNNFVKYGTKKINPKLTKIPIISASWHRYEHDLSISSKLLLMFEITIKKFLKFLYLFSLR
jgi:hypothetical protein